MALIRQGTSGAFEEIEGANQNLASVLGFGNSASGERIVSLADGIDPQDAATVGQLPVVPGPQSLASVLSAGNSAGAQRIVSLANGLNAQDAATVAQLRALPSPYTVSATPGAARFQTIQEAVNQAITDGASFFSPAVIDIFPGYYEENVIASGGGLAFRGVGGEWLTYLEGTLTLNNAPGTSNGWALSGMGINGAVTVAGASGSGYGIDISDAQLFRRLVIEDASNLQLSVKNGTLIWSLGAPALPVIGIGSGVPVSATLRDSRLGQAIDEEVLVGSYQIRNCLINGRVRLTGERSSIIGGAIYSNQQVCVTDETTVVSDLLNPVLWRNGGVGPVISHTGAGQLTVAAWYAEATPPYIANTGGPVILGGPIGAASQGSTVITHRIPITIPAGSGGINVDVNLAALGITTQITKVNVSYLVQSAGLDDWSWFTGDVALVKGTSTFWDPSPSFFGNQVSRDNLGGSPGALPQGIGSTTSFRVQIGSIDPLQPDLVGELVLTLTPVPAL